MKKLIGLMLLVSLTACGTVAGFGNDISGAANWTKEKMTGSNSQEK